MTITDHLSATLIGVVRQEVKMSAGNSGFIGSSSPTSQAASWIQSLDKLRLAFSDESSTLPLHIRDDPSLVYTQVTSNTISTTLHWYIFRSLAVLVLCHIL